MVDKSNEYGYVPSSPTQARGSNTGVFEVNDIVDLLNAEQWSGEFNALELIETRTFTTQSTINFTTSAITDYDVHFFTFNHTLGGNTPALRVSSNGGSSWLQTNEYDWNYRDMARQFASGTEYRSNGTYFMPLSRSVSYGHGVGSNVWIYNMNNADKYTHFTIQSAGTMTSDGINYYSRTFFGNGYVQDKAIHNALQLLPNTGTLSGTASLYGLKQS